MNDTLIAELLAKHKRVKSEFKALQEQERKIRDKIVQLLFPNPKTGTNKKSFKELGLEVKAVIKDYWSVKQDGLEEILCANENLSRAFKYKHELVMAGYKSLSDNEKILLADTVTCKPTAPELSYEGSIPGNYFDCIKTHDFEIYIMDVKQDDSQVVSILNYYGFQSKIDLIKFLEEIQ